MRSTNWPRSSRNSRKSWTSSSSAVFRSPRSPRCAASPSDRSIAPGKRAGSICITRSPTPNRRQATTVGRLTTERWRTLNQYLDEALEIRTEERAAWLAPIAARDAALAADLQRLLNEHDDVR